MAKASCFPMETEQNGGRLVFGPLESRTSKHSVFQCVLYSNVWYSSPRCIHGNLTNAPKVYLGSQGVHGPLGGNHYSELTQQQNFTRVKCFTKSASLFLTSSAKMSIFLRWEAIACNISMKVLQQKFSYFFLFVSIVRMSPVS